MLVCEAEKLPAQQAQAKESTKAAQQAEAKESKKAVDVVDVHAAASWRMSTSDFGTPPNPSRSPISKSVPRALLLQLAC